MSSEAKRLVSILGASLSISDRQVIKTLRKIRHNVMTSTDGLHQLANLPCVSNIFGLLQCSILQQQVMSKDVVNLALSIVGNMLMDDRAIGQIRKDGVKTIVTLLLQYDDPDIKTRCCRCLGNIACSAQTHNDILEANSIAAIITAISAQFLEVKHQQLASTCDQTTSLSTASFLSSALDNKSAFISSPDMASALTASLDIASGFTISSGLTSPAGLTLTVASSSCMTSDSTSTILIPAHDCLSVSTLRPVPSCIVIAASPTPAGGLMTTAVAVRPHSITLVSCDFGGYSSRAALVAQCVGTSRTISSMFSLRNMLHGDLSQSSAESSYDSAGNLSFIGTVPSKISNISVLSSCTQFTCVSSNTPSSNCTLSSSTSSISTSSISSSSISTSSISSSAIGTLSCSVSSTGTFSIITASNGVSYNGSLPSCTSSSKVLLDTSSNNTLYNSMSTNGTPSNKTFLSSTLMSSASSTSTTVSRIMPPIRDSTICSSVAAGNVRHVACSPVNRFVVPAPALEMRYACVQLVQAACRVLRKLLASRTALRQMVKCVPCMVSLINSGNNHLCRPALFLLAEFLHKVNKRHVALLWAGLVDRQLCGQLMLLVDSDDDEVSRHSLSVLVLLASSPHGAACVGASDGITFSLAHMGSSRRHIRSLDMLAIMCLLSKEAVNRIKLREAGALSAILSALNDDKMADVHDRIISSLLNFVHDHASLSVMIASDLVPTLMHHLQRCGHFNSNPVFHFGKLNFQVTPICENVHTTQSPGIPHQKTKPHDQTKIPLENDLSTLYPSRGADGSDVIFVNSSECPKTIEELNGLCLGISLTQSAVVFTPTCGHLTNNVNLNGTLSGPTSGGSDFNMSVMNAEDVNGRLCGADGHTGERCAPLDCEWSMLWSDSSQSCGTRRPWKSGGDYLATDCKSHNSCFCPISSSGGDTLSPQASSEASLPSFPFSPLSVTSYISPPYFPQFSPSHSSPSRSSSYSACSPHCAATESDYIGSPCSSMPYSSVCSPYGTCTDRMVAYDNHDDSTLIFSSSDDDEENSEEVELDCECVSNESFERLSGSVNASHKSSSTVLCYAREGCAQGDIKAPGIQPPLSAFSPSKCGLLSKCDSRMPEDQVYCDVSSEARTECDFSPPSKRRKFNEVFFPPNYFLVLFHNAGLTVSPVGESCVKTVGSDGHSSPHEIVTQDNILMLLSQLSVNEDFMAHLTSTMSIGTLFDHLVFAVDPQPRCLRILSRLLTNPQFFDNWLAMCLPATIFHKFLVNSEGVITNPDPELLSHMGPPGSSLCSPYMLSEFGPCVGQSSIIAASPPANDTVSTVVQPKTDFPDRCSPLYVSNSRSHRSPRETGAQSNAQSAFPVETRSRFDATRTGWCLLKDIAEQAMTTYGEQVVVNSVRCPRHHAAHVSTLASVLFFLPHWSLERRYTFLFYHGILDDVLTILTDHVYDNSHIQGILITGLIHAIRCIYIKPIITPLVKQRLLQKAIKARNPLHNTDNDMERKTCVYSTCDRDLEIVVGAPESTLTANRSCLTCHSSVFSAMLDGAYQERNMTRVTISDTNHSSLLPLLHYLHGCGSSCHFFLQLGSSNDSQCLNTSMGKTGDHSPLPFVDQDIIVGNLLGAMALADRFLCFDFVPYLCSCILTAASTLSNLEIVFRFAILHGRSSLSEECLHRMMCSPDPLAGIANQFMCLLRDDIGLSIPALLAGLFKRGIQCV